MSSSGTFSEVKDNGLSALMGNVAPDEQNNDETQSTHKDEKSSRSSNGSMPATQNSPPKNHSNVNYYSIPIDYQEFYS